MATTVTPENVSRVESLIKKDPKMAYTVTGCHEDFIGKSHSHSSRLPWCKEIEVQQNTGIPVRTGVSRAYRYGSAVRYVPVHSGVFGSLYGNYRSSVTRHCLTSV